MSSSGSDGDDDDDGVGDAAFDHLNEHSLEIHSVLLDDLFTGM